MFTIHEYSLQQHYQTYLKTILTLYACYELLFLFMKQINNLWCTLLLCVRFCLNKKKKKNFLEQEIKKVLLPGHIIIKRCLFKLLLFDRFRNGTFSQKKTYNYSDQAQNRLHRDYLKPFLKHVYRHVFLDCRTNQRVK